jgi:hypothetical protein
MKGLIRASLANPHAVIVMCLAIAVLGGLTIVKLPGFTAMNTIPVDILPVFKSPAVQVLTFYGGMPAPGMEKDITNRMERWTGQANGMRRQESRSIMGASIVRNLFGRPGPQRRPDAGELACPGRDPEPATGHAAARRVALRSDQHHARGACSAKQQIANGGNPV